MTDKFKELVVVLKNKGLVLVTAESCTGGMIAKSITDVSGSSAVFDRGFVTYSNDAKIEMLGVSPDTIDIYGAVSSECASEMAIGAINNSNASISISVTGIAGPDGGTDDKPVGLVYIGLSDRNKHVSVKKCLFYGNREDIRKQSCEEALELLLNQASSN